MTLFSPVNIKAMSGSAPLYPSFRNGSGLYLMPSSEMASLLRPKTLKSLNILRGLAMTAVGALLRIAYFGVLATQNPSSGEFLPYPSSSLGQHKLSRMPWYPGL